MKLLCCLFAPVLLSIASACSGTETGNPGKSEKLALAARASDPSIATLGEPQANFGVSSLWVSLSAIELVPCEQNQPRVTVPPIARDVMAAASKQLFEFEISEGRYCALQVVFEKSPSLPADAPPELASGTIWLRGARADGAQFRLLSNATPIVQLRSSSANPQPLRFESGASLLLAFDVSKLFADVQVDLPQGPNIPLLDENTRPQALATFNGNISLSVSLHVDANGNGLVDPDEQTPLAEP